MKKKIDKLVSRGSLQFRTRYRSLRVCFFTHSPASFFSNSEI